MLVEHWATWRDVHWESGALGLGYDDTHLGNGPGLKASDAQDIRLEAGAVDEHVVVALQLNACSLRGRVWN